MRTHTTPRSAVTQGTLALPRIIAALRAPIVIAALRAPIAPLRVPVAAVALCMTLAVLAPAAGAEPTTPVATSATIVPALSPDRPGARAALTLTLSYAGGEAGVPTPVRKLIVQLPAGLGIEIPKLRSCSPTRLRTRGPSGCPAQSRLGSGHALAEVRAGSQLLTENVTLSAFVGAPRSGAATLVILGQGYTPRDARVVVTGTVSPGRTPYGEALALPIPPIPSLPLEPDASLVRLSLTLGMRDAHRHRDANAVVVPSHCPAGGFPFAAESTYADGSSATALATVPCAR